jgi:hypothetical protein
MPALEVLAILLAVPGTVTAIGDLCTQRSIARRASRSRRTEIEIRFRVRIRRT